MTTLDAGPWTLERRYGDDAFRAMQAWLADPVVTASIGRWPDTLSRQEFDAIVRVHDGRTGWMFMVRSAQDSAIHGYASIQVDPGSGVARLDIVVGDRRAPSRSLLSHVTRALIPWMFETVGVRKIGVYVRADNRVTAAWLKSRMTLEGRHRGEMVMPDGTAVDLLYFGLLSSEWRDAVAASEASVRSEWDRPIRSSLPGPATHP